MSLVPRFGAYAAAFEEAYASDDWSVVAPFFTDDAVYEVGLGPPLGGRFEGRDAVLAYFKAALDGFDRRFATRSVHLLEGPEERDGAVWLRGRAVYTAPGLPDLGFTLEEIATFEGDRIRHLEDRYPASEREAIERYVAAHGARLGLGMA